MALTSLPPPLPMCGCTIIESSGIQRSAKSHPKKKKGNKKYAVVFEDKKREQEWRIPSSPLPGERQWNASLPLP